MYLYGIPGWTALGSLCFGWPLFGLAMAPKGSKSARPDGGKGAKAAAAAPPSTAKPSPPKDAAAAKAATAADKKPKPAAAAKPEAVNIPPPPPKEEPFAPTTVLVLGAYGSVGSAMCRVLLEQSTTVKLILVGRDAGKASAFSKQLNAEFPSLNLKVQRTSAVGADASDTSTLQEIPRFGTRSICLGLCPAPTPYPIGSQVTPSA